MCLQDISPYLTHIPARPRRKMHAEWTQHGSEGQRKLVSKNESHPFWLSFDKSIDRTRYMWHQKMCLQNISPPRTLRISWNTARYNLFFFFFFFFFFISIKAPHYICIRKCVIPHVTCASGNVFARYFPVPYAYSGQTPPQNACRMDPARKRGSKKARE